MVESILIMSKDFGSSSMYVIYVLFKYYCF